MSKTMIAGIFIFAGLLVFLMCAYMNDWITINFEKGVHITKNGSQRCRYLQVRLFGRRWLMEV